MKCLAVQGLTYEPFTETGCTGVIFSKGILTIHIAQCSEENCMRFINRTGKSQNMEKQGNEKEKRDRIHKIIQPSFQYGSE